jgi:hypothetical protein
MARANGDRNSLLFSLRVPELSNVVIRDVRDRDGRRLGGIVQPHNGTELGVVTAAQAATDRMYAEFSMASNVQSRICATDFHRKLQMGSLPYFAGVHRRDVDLPAYGPPTLEPRRVNRRVQPYIAKFRSARSTGQIRGSSNSRESSDELPPPFHGS